VAGSLARSRCLGRDTLLRLVRALPDPQPGLAPLLGVDDFAFPNGRRHRDAIQQTSLDHQTLRNNAWVARQVPLSRRRDSLSFGHHTEMAALAQAEQDFWLRKAEELSWPVRQLRQQVRAASANAMRARPARESRTVVLASGHHHMRLWSFIGGRTWKLRLKIA
jgi:hypothetical protein